MSAKTCSSLIKCRGIITLVHAREHNAKKIVNNAASSQYESDLDLIRKLLTHKAPPTICSRRHEVPPLQKAKSQVIFARLEHHYEPACQCVTDQEKVIIFRQTILMKYHSFFFLKIKKDVAKFVVCCSCDWRFKGLLLAKTE